VTVWEAGAVLVDAEGRQVGAVPPAALLPGESGDRLDRIVGPGQLETVVWRGRVFQWDEVVPPRDRPAVWREVRTVSVETPMACPGCGVERTDYEGEPGGFLSGCPNCASDAHPVPVGLADVPGEGVWVPRDLLTVVRSEIRAETGHWAEGFTAAGAPIARHDIRGPGGSCVVCQLLQLLDAYLYPGREAAGV
jgi:hypothetical protein